MKILAIDTSSDACSAAVLTDEACQVEFELTPRAHTRLILPMVESVLTTAGLQLTDVDAIAFGRGPGAFTGVRIATGVAQGLALAAGKPVLPVSTLAALAQRAWQETGALRVLAALDARMDEVYWGEYCVDAGGYMALQADEVVIGPDAVPLPDGVGWTAVGSAWQAYPEPLLQRFAGKVSAIHADWLPSAEYIARLAARDWRQGRALPATEAQPVYLRNKVAQTTRERATSSP